MSPASILCEYIFGSFLVVQAALEVSSRLAQTAFTMLNTAFEAILSLFRFTMDIAIDTIINAVRVAQQSLVELLWDPREDMKGFCKDLYKCNIFIEQLTDSNSLICKTLIKLGVLTREQQQFINQIISEFYTFSSTICNFGFTFNFGLSAIKQLCNMYKSTIEGFLRTIERKKESIRRMIQTYINQLIDIGIFDLLIKLRKFFNCILADTKACSSIKTAHNFYNDMLAKLHIEEAGGGDSGSIADGSAGSAGYRLASFDNNRIKNAFDSRLNRLNNVKDEMTKFADTLVSPSDVRTASNAFNLSKHIFPGGMSWTDLKKGRWHKNAAYRYFEVKRDAFIEAFFGKHQDTLPDDTNAEFIINGMTVNDNAGTITIKLNEETEEVIDMNDNTAMASYADSVTVVTPEEPIEYYTEGAEVDIQTAMEYDGIIMSGNRAAVRIAVEGDTGLEDHCKKAYLNVTNFIKESEMVTKS